MKKITTAKLKYAQRQRQPKDAAVLNPARPLTAIVKGQDVFVGALKHTPTKAQEAMIKDGLPREFAQSDEQRALIRANSPPPRPMPTFSATMREEGEDTKRFRAQLEAQERVRKSSAADVSPHIAAKRAARAARPERPSREGMTTVAMIAESLKILPRIARGHLRAAKEPKPPQGWAYADAKDVARITNIIKAGETSCKSKSSTTKERKPRSTKAVKRSTPSSRVSTASSAPKKSKSSSKKATSSTRSKARTAKKGEVT